MFFFEGVEVNFFYIDFGKVVINLMVLIFLDYLNLEFLY